MTIALANISVCPACKGSRKDYSLKHHRLMACELCEARGWVPVESCRGCGRPAIKFWPRKGPPIVKYCGLESCLTALVTIHRTTKSNLVKVVELIDRANQRVDVMEELKQTIKARLGPKEHGPRA